MSVAALGSRRRGQLRIALPFGVALCLLCLALPGFASAATYTVNDTLDAPSVPGAACGAAEECSLRAAIEELNLAAQPANTIAFDPAVFNGQQEDTISLGSPLQTILYPVSIVAGSGCTIAGISGAPCAGVVGTGADPVLAIEGDNSSISGLSIANGSIGIGVFGETTGFTATADWIGIPMSGTNEGNAGAGIFIGPGSDGAVIGGVAAGNGNLIAHNEVGLDIEGASDATVQGNQFGQPGGGVDPEPADTNIEITDSTEGAGFKAENNEVGAVLSGAAQATAACDGGCNVISSANGPGINLNGAGGTKKPASGPTTIHGNFIGLDPTGAFAVDNDTYKGNKTFGVLAGEAGHVTVGGASGSETNFIVGGEAGISSVHGADFKASGNEIGLNSIGAAAKSPSSAGVFVSSAGITERATIAENQIRLEVEGEGISHKFIGATISDNVVEGGEIGISSMGSNAPTGSLIEGNLIEGPEEAGIVVGNSDNEVLGNEILHSEGMGIEVNPGSTVDLSGNLIGGNSSAEENAIFGSGAYAILLQTTENSRNEVGRNHGSGNEGEAGFIVLRPFNGPENDPNGAKRPTITSALKTEASGKALPGARVRVFRKASSEEGELAGFLGEAIANGSGEWKVSYAAVPGKTLVTATQTNVEGGTSDLAETATTPADPPPPPPVCPEAGATGCEPPPKPPATKPKVTIKSGPKAKSASTTAKFKFTSNEAGSTFKCKLDNKAFAKCGSPKTYKKLKPGRHVFKVTASDAAGNVSAVVTRKFTVLE